MAEEELELFLKRRFPGKEELIKRCVKKLADEGFSSLADCNSLSFDEARGLGVPFAFAARLSDEGHFKQVHLSSSRPLKPRSFYSGDAIDVEQHYYSRWPDFDALVNDMDEGKWLLLTGPWQSGKTSLLTALGVALQAKGYLVVLTTLDDAMVSMANNLRKEEVEAAGDFFTRLVDKLCHASELRKPTGEVLAVTDVFRVPEEGNTYKNVIWLVDEAQVLNYIYHHSGYAVRQLLSGLREAKRESASRNKLGKYRLHSFCLCGLPQLASLIGDARRRRVDETEKAGETCVPSSPHDPLRPQLSCWTAPLSKQVHRDVWRLDDRQVAGMILEYAEDRHKLFTLTLDGDQNKSQHAEAVSAISRDIVERTSGHIGLVGCCCSFLEKIGDEIRSLEHWLQLARRGRLRSFVFGDNAYGKMVRVVAAYPERVKSVILECIDSPDGCSDVDDYDTVLEAMVDGVLEKHGIHQVRFTSPLLLSTILESCKFARMGLTPASAGSLVEAYELAISLMNPEVFLRPKALDVSGQPSEYMIQSLLLRGLMFVMEQGFYTLQKYHVFVEVKERDEEGVRTRRMDGFLEKTGAAEQGLEIQVGSKAESSKTVKDHLERSAYSMKLHGCEMSYMYFWVGDDDDPTGAKAAMNELRHSFVGVTCWYVRFGLSTRVWTIQRLQDNGIWLTTTKALPPEFPSFMLSSLATGKRQGF